MRKKGSKLSARFCIRCDKSFKPIKKHTKICEQCKNKPIRKSQNKRGDLFIIKNSDKIKYKLSQKSIFNI